MFGDKLDVVWENMQGLLHYVVQNGGKITSILGLLASLAGLLLLIDYFRMLYLRRKLVLLPPSVKDQQLIGTSLQDLYHGP